MVEQLKNKSKTKPKAKKLLKKDVKSKKVVKKAEEFRIRASHLFLTYPKCNLNALEALNQLRYKIFSFGGAQVESVLSVNENHFERETKHLHIYLKLSKKIEVRNAHTFDLEPNREYLLTRRDWNFIPKAKKPKLKWHGNYEGCKNRNSIVQYLCKQADRIEAYTTADLKLRIDDRRYLRVEQYLIKLADQGNFQEAITYYKQFKPNTYFKRPIKCIHQLKENYEINKRLKGLSQRIFDWRHINWEAIPDVLINYLLAVMKGSQNNKTIWIVGTTGIGKTSVILRLLEGLKLDYVRITHNEDLKNVDSNKNQLLLFDDTTLNLRRNKDKTELEQLTLRTFNTNHEATIDVKYTRVTLKQNREQVFLRNFTYHEILLKLGLDVQRQATNQLVATTELDKALERRVIEIQLEPEVSLLQKEALELIQTDEFKVGKLIPTLNCKKHPKQIVLEKACKKYNEVNNELITLLAKEEAKFSPIVVANTKEYAYSYFKEVTDETVIQNSD